MLKLTSTVGNHFDRSMTDEEAKMSGGACAPSSLQSEAQYDLTYAERGTRVAMVASEPITGSKSDWVKVPKNTALVISREKSGFVNIMRAPVSSTGSHPRQEEVLRYLLNDYHIVQSLLGLCIC